MVCRDVLWSPTLSQCNDASGVLGFARFQAVREIYSFECSDTKEKGFGGGSGDVSGETRWLG